MRAVSGYAVQEPGGELLPWRFERRDLRSDDVAVRVTFCGVCHTDVHAVDGAGAGQVPLVPGHEFVGEVAAVGAEVTRFAVGDRVAVGNIVDSCGVCASCTAGEEPYCTAGPTLTYGGTTGTTAAPSTGGTPASTSPPRVSSTPSPPGSTRRARRR